MVLMNTTHVITVALGSVLAAGYGLGRVRPIHTVRKKAIDMLDYADLHGTRSDERKAVAAYLITHPVVGLSRTAKYYSHKLQGKPLPGQDAPAGPEPRRPAPVYN